MLKFRKKIFLLIHVLMLHLEAYRRVSLDSSYIKYGLSIFLLEV